MDARQLKKLKNETFLLPPTAGFGYPEVTTPSVDPW
jgi:hypothetical protein